MLQLGDLDAYTGYTPSGYPTFYLPTSVTEKSSASNSVVTATAYNADNKYVPLTTKGDAGAGKLNLTTTYTYDGIGNLTRVNGPRADSTDFADIVTTAYDAERRPIQITNALGKVTYIAYDADGHPIRSAAQIGKQWLVSCQNYSPSGKLLKAWGPGLTAAATNCTLLIHENRPNGGSIAVDSLLPVEVNYPKCYKGCGETKKSR